MDTIAKDVEPAVTQTDDEITTWNTLPRDEQLRRLREELSHPDACVSDDSDMVGIWAEIKARRGGG